MPGATASLLAVFLGKHCWTSQQWHLSKETGLLHRNSTEERARHRIYETEYLAFGEIIGALEQPGMTQEEVP